MSIERFLESITEEAKQFKKLATGTVVLLHHNDTDGLTAGAILAAALERLGVKLYRYSLEKPYPEALERILSDEDLPDQTVILITDFGSGMLPQISKINSRHFETFILDHHTIQPQSDPRLHLVNCLTFSIPGSSHCSSSAIAALFALALDSKNSDLAWLGVLGALGDHQFDESGNLIGVNSHVLSNHASNKVTMKGREYFVKLSDGEFKGEEIVDWVNALGSFGYLRGGTDIAIKGLREGFDLRYRGTADKFKVEFSECFDKWLLNLELEVTKHVNWFILPESFSGFGVKSVGLVCEKLLRLGKVDDSKYLAGFQTIPSVIPGLGNVDLGQSKVSMRIPIPLLNKVKANQAPGLPDILPPATRDVGGFTDGCHLHAGASTVKVGEEKKLIEALEKRL